MLVRRERLHARFLRFWFVRVCMCFCLRVPVFMRVRLCVCVRVCVLVLCVCGHAAHSVTLYCQVLCARVRMCVFVPVQVAVGLVLAMSASSITIILAITIIFAIMVVWSSSSLSFSSFGERNQVVDLISTDEDFATPRKKQVSTSLLHSPLCCATPSTACSTSDGRSSLPTTSARNTWLTRLLSEAFILP